LGDLFRGHARRNPDKIGLVTDQERYTFAELEELSNRIANGILDLGIQMGDHVALLLENGPEIFISYFAIPKVGVVVIPLNTKLAEHELIHCIRDSKPKLLIYGQDDFPPELISSLKDTFPEMKFFDLKEYNELIQKSSPEHPRKRLPHRVDKNSVATIIYTGGTTGLPKGVLLTHHNILSTITNFGVSALKSRVDSGGGIIGGFDLSLEQKVLTPLPFFHAACSTGLISSMLAGMTVYLKKKFEAIDFLKTIEREKITSILIVPTILNVMLNEDLSKYDLSSLKMIIYGASPISESVLARALDEFPHVDFIQLFGQTEASPVLTFFSIDDHRKARKNKKLLKSAGKPIIGVEIKIVDPTDQEVPIGTVGEVIARGEGIMKGYLNQPEKTEFTLRGGWLHTGDLGYVDEEGYVYIVGRSKDMIVSGGENIYPKEVENVIQKHPAVFECAVIGIPHKKYQEAVCACIVPVKGCKPGENITEEEIIEYCKKNLARYKAPKKIDFLRRLPKSPQGKILKRKLRKPYWEGREREVV